MQKLYVYARKIHRLLVLLMVVLTVVMTLTGSMMKYPLAVRLLFFFDPVFARSIHNLISPLFSFVLLGMVVTGLYMYVYPKIRRTTPP